MTIRTRFIGQRFVLGLLCLSLFLLPAARAQAFNPEVLNSVVSVLPQWPGMAQGGNPEIPPGVAPEGSAVAILPGGYLATALHVVDKALSVTVRLYDGRELAAEIVGRDPPSDLALLKVAAELPLLPAAPEPSLGSPVCAIGNQFGLDLSVTCGVVSGLRRTGTGFNPIEDFVQTDATVNPGSSGGALVDGEGRLVGLLSAIFAKESDASIGVNFAVSHALLMRVMDDLAADGQVRRASPGLRFVNLSAEERAQAVGVKVAGVRPDGPGEAAGFESGDIVTSIDGRSLRKLSDAITALQLRRPGDELTLAVLRDGAPLRLKLILAK